MKTFDELKQIRTKELFAILEAFELSNDRQRIVWSLLFSAMSDAYDRGRLDKEQSLISQKEKI